MTRLRSGKCLDAQADLVICFVEINDLCSNFLTGLKYIRRLVNVLLGDLGNVKQSVDTGL